MKEYKFNASNQILGRLATQIAVLLQAKNTPQYEQNKAGGVRVIVDNISKIKVTGKKYNQKLYRHHTGYIGHLKTRTYKQVFEKNPSEVLRKAVMGMLPKNKLRSKRIKNLIIND
ncbi:MAG: 50S ribosomal protein L13 [Smithellaceae bacterium]|jgi:large subunit ribosomal protein L13|nr:50S ribosomal protein L13 [Smithellaceae bacterium]